MPSQKAYWGKTTIQMLICSKHYSSNIHLKKHIRTHIGEKISLYPMWQGSFSGHLTSHMGIHSRKKACNRKKLITQKYYTDSDELQSKVEASHASVIYCSSQDIKQVLTLFILISWKNYTIVRALKFYICHYFQKELDYLLF